MHNLIYIFGYLIILLTTIKISKILKFYDIPNSRKDHPNKVLNTSGLTIFIFCIMIVFTNDFSIQINKIFIAGSFVMFIGFIDDRINLKPSIKIILLLFPVAYLIFNGFSLEHLGNYEIVGTIKLGFAGAIFTFMCVGVLLNSYNYIDGIDGLLCSLSIINLSYFLILIEDKSLIILFSLISIGLMINCIFNLLPNKNSFKIFMGDSGSLFIGFLISFFMIYLFKYEDIHPSYLIWSCWIVIYDFLFVTFYRIIKKKKFFVADKIHLHHYLLRFFGNSHFKTTFIINILNLSILIIGYFTAKYFGNIFSLMLFIVLSILYFTIRYNAYSIDPK